MWENAQDVYLEQRVLSADPLELVRLLYQAAIAAVRHARRELGAGEIAARSRSISRACGILLELNGALDHVQGGEISTRLAALYDYMLRRLLEANMQQSDALLAEVLGLLCTLSEAWEQARVAADPLPVENAWRGQAGPALVAGSHAWSV